MAKLKVKGTVIKQTISASLTAVAQITEFNHDGAESETYDATTIDTSGAGKEYSQTGYSEGGNFGFEDGHVEWQSNKRVSLGSDYGGSWQCFFKIPVATPVQ